MSCLIADLFVSLCSFYSLSLLGAGPLWKQPIPVFVLDPINTPITEYPENHAQTMGIREPMLFSCIKVTTLTVLHVYFVQTLSLNVRMRAATERPVCGLKSSPGII